MNDVAHGGRRDRFSSPHVFRYLDRSRGNGMALGARLRYQNA
jgi:hypothetical protein